MTGASEGNVIKVYVVHEAMDLYEDVEIKDRAHKPAEIEKGHFSYSNVGLCHLIHSTYYFIDYGKKQ